MRFSPRFSYPTHLHVRKGVAARSKARLLDIVQEEVKSATRIASSVTETAVTSLPLDTHSSEYSRIRAKFSYRKSSFRIVPVFRATSSFSYLEAKSVLTPRTELDRDSPAQNHVYELLVSPDIVHRRTAVPDLASQQQVEDLRGVLLRLFRSDQFETRFQGGRSERTSKSNLDMFRINTLRISCEYTSLAS